MYAFLIIALAAALAFLVGKVFVRHPSPVLALLGALAGCRLMIYGAGSYLWQWPLAQAAAALTALLLSAGLTFAIGTILRKSRMHYLGQMWIMGIVSKVAMVLLLFAAVFNFCSFFAYIFVQTVHPGILFLVSAVSAGILVRPFDRRFFQGADDGQFDINSESALSMLLSVAAVSLLFSSSKVTSLLCCERVALPLSVIALSSLWGCALARRRALMETSPALRTMFAAFVVPSAGLIAGYFGSALLPGTSLDTGSGAFLLLVSLASALVFIVFAALIVRMFLSSRRSSHALKEAEDCLNENRRAVNAMEVKTMQTENEYLRNRIELQRREVMNAAIGISEQREFIGRISAMVKEAEAAPDIEGKNEMLHAIGTELSLRMNFSDEIDSFYTQAEKLHKDFAVRLNERFPDLTKQEKRLTTLLRLGFSSKYIATLMNISPKSVEICRHRLRTKFGLDRQESLTGFIGGI